jgi:oligopeptide transport system substrate-binding protein
VIFLARLPERWGSIILTTLLFAVGLAVLVGCDGGERGRDALARITLYLNTEPPSLNTVVSDDNTSYQIIDHISEGLLGFDLDNRLAPGVAERWEFDPRRGATFHLRQNARWSDGSPVTAGDFVFAWRQAVDPGVGSSYAYIMYPVRNGEAINKGRLRVEALGVSALDDHTLNVELERPTPYFLSLTAFSVYRPIKEAFYRREGQRYAAGAEDLLYNGPFVIKRWIHGADLLLEKNPRYWNRDAVSIDQIAYPYFTSDPSTVLNLYRDGRLSMAALSEQGIEIALQEHYRIRVKDPGVVNFLGFNLKPAHATHSYSLRRAIQAVINPVELQGRIIGSPGTEPGVSLFPAWMRRRFMDDAALYAPTPLDKVAITALLAKAAREARGIDVHAMSLLITDDTVSAKLAEYLQQVFAEQLSIRLKIDRQTFKQLLAKTDAADYDIVFSSWAPDFDDPLAYANVLVQRYADGSRLFEDADADRTYDIAATSDNVADRNAAFRELHRIVVDRIPLIPIIVAGGSQFSLYVQDPRLQSVRRSNIAGDPNFNYARFVSP